MDDKSWEGRETRRGRDGSIEEREEVGCIADDDDVDDDAEDDEVELGLMAIAVHVGVRGPGEALDEDVVEEECVEERER